MSLAAVVCGGFIPNGTRADLSENHSGGAILLVDDAEVLYRSGTRRIVTPFVRHTDNPLIRCDCPWEVAIGWSSVYRDPQSGRYQLWYQAYAGERARLKTHACVVCYAESTDGIHFTKPQLDLNSFNDTPRTNIVLVGAGGTSVRYSNSVVVDPREPDPTRRYKMCYFDFGKENGKEYPGLHVAFSPDGIRWTKHSNAPLQRVAYGDYGAPVPFTDEQNRPWDIPLSMSDAVDVFKDTKRGVFAIYGKMWIDGPDGGMFFKHGMGRIESPDFIHWSKPQLVLAPDDSDKPWVEFHSSSVFLHEGVYFGLLQILDRATGGGVIDIELATSRDGLHWERPFRKEFVLARRPDVATAEPGSALAKPGSTFDSGSIFTNAQPIILDDQIRFYYGGYSQGATGADDTKQISGVGLATIPLDRFAGITAVERSDQPTLPKPLENTGQITLKPRDLTGITGLSVNAAAAKGMVRVEILDENGRRIRGFSREDCFPITGDDLRQTVAWKSRKISDLPAGKYMLRLHLNRATVYAVYLQD